MFDEIKAKLGLDITSFEKGLVKAQGSLSDVVGGAAKKFTDFKQIGNTVSTAIGLNLQTLSEGLARIIVGFSKQQEEALLNLVETSKNAADELSNISLKKRAGDDPQKRIELLDKEAESLRLQAQGVRKLSIGEKLSIINKDGIIAGIAKIGAEEENLAKNSRDAQIRLGQISRLRLAAEEELKQKNKDADKKRNEEVSKNFKAGQDEREKRKFNELSIDEKIAKRREDAAKADKDYNDKNKTSEERAAAFLKREQMLTELKNLENQRTEETKKQLDLEDQKLKKLQEQKKAITEGMREARRNAVLPTLEDVTSGKRNIGAGAARTASALVAERQRSLSLADQVQRDFERMNTRGLSIMQQVQAERAYAASYAALGISQQRIKTGEEMLGNRILDANPYAQMEKELADIKKGINTLNNETLKPTSTR